MINLLHPVDEIRPLQMVVLANFGANKLRLLRSNAFITGPGRQWKVEQKKRTNSGNFAGRNSATLRGDDQKNKCISEYEINECLSVNVYVFIGVV